MDKYLKYKNKYLNLKNKVSLLKGGLIGRIPESKLDEMKTDNEIPDEIKSYIKMITIKDTKVIRVGSSMNKIQPYYSDIDVMNIIELKKNTLEVIRFFIDNLKILLKNISLQNNVFFSDFKAGSLHWTVEQIMNEQNGELSLTNACTMKDVVKLDIIGPYNERFLEMSTFFILKSISEYINVENNYFDNFKKSLLVDINHYKDTKPFKAVKRVWSLAKLNKDDNTLKMLADIIKSNIALISQINADVETLVLLIEHNSNFDVKFVLRELDGFRERLSPVIDIPLDNEKINLFIDYIKLLFVFRDINKEVNNNVIEGLNRFHDYLLNIVNKETFEYLRSINYKFPTSNNLGNVKIEEVEIEL
jgi:hypothetical protein